MLAKMAQCKDCHSCYEPMHILFLFLLFFQLITVVGITLNGANVVGYVKCRRDAGVKLTKMAGNFIGKQILQQTLSGDSTKNEH